MVEKRTQRDVPFWVNQEEYLEPDLGQGTKDRRRNGETLCVWLDSPEPETPWARENRRKREAEARRSEAAATHRRSIRDQNQENALSVPWSIQDATYEEIEAC